jgi:hypothetical protein
MAKLGKKCRLYCHQCGKFRNAWASISVTLYVCSKCLENRCNAKTKKKRYGR